jgi:outer membrane protein TolC
LRGARNCFSELGIGTAGADVGVAEATLRQAQATLSPLQKQLAVQRDLLTALIGRLPSQGPAESFELATCQAIATPANSVLIATIPPYPRNPLITPPSVNS